MQTEGKADFARQAANVAGALFQVFAGFLMPFAAAARGGAPVRPLIQPADYAFAIWAPIFLLGLAYATYQALPVARTSPLLQHAGWFTFGAFFCNGLFEVAVAQRQFVVAQLFILGAFVCASVAYLRLARAGRDAVGGAGRFLVALPVGLFFGWITAATVVNAAGVAVLAGLPEGGRGEVVLSGLLLLAGGIFAAAIVLVGRNAAATGYLAYAAAILWAFAGIVVAQGGMSVAITGVAILASLPVVVAPFQRARR